MIRPERSAIYWISPSTKRQPLVLPPAHRPRATIGRSSLTRHHPERALSPLFALTPTPMTPSHTASFYDPTFKRRAVRRNEADRAASERWGSPVNPSGPSLTEGRVLKLTGTAHPGIPMFQTSIQCKQRRIKSYTTNPSNPIQDPSSKAPLPPNIPSSPYHPAPPYWCLTLYPESGR